MYSCQHCAGGGDDQGAGQAEYEGVATMGGEGFGSGELGTTVSFQKIKTCV